MKTLGKYYKNITYVDISFYYFWGHCNDLRWPIKGNITCEKNIHIFYTRNASFHIHPLFAIYFSIVNNFGLPTLEEAEYAPNAIFKKWSGMVMSYIKWKLLEHNVSFKTFQDLTQPIKNDYFRKGVNFTHNSFHPLYPWHL